MASDPKARGSCQEGRQDDRRGLIITATRRCPGPYGKTSWGGCRGSSQAAAGGGGAGGRRADTTFQKLGCEGGEAAGAGGGCRLSLSNSCHLTIRGTGRRGSPEMLPRRAASTAVNSASRCRPTTCAPLPQPARPCPAQPRHPGLAGACAVKRWPKPGAE